MTPMWESKVSDEAQERRALWARIFDTLMETGSYASKEADTDAKALVDMAFLWSEERSSGV